MKLIHENATKDGLEFLYRYIFGIWLFIVAFDPLTDLAYLPSQYFMPTGFLLKFWPDSLYPIFLSVWFLAFLKIAMIISLVCVLLNRSRPAMSVTACVLLTIYQSIIRSFGHINHPELMLLLTAYILTVFAFEKFERRSSADLNPYAVPFLVILFFYSFTYSFAGVHRLVHSGIDIFKSDTIIYWIVENGRRSRGFSWNLDHLVLKYEWLAMIIKVGFVAVTAAEILAPLYLISRFFRYAFVLVMLPFHIFVWLFMGIFFWQNILLYIMFIDLISRIVWKKK